MVQPLLIFHNSFSCILSILCFQFCDLFPNAENEMNKLVLDFSEEKEVLISVDEQLVLKLKPHQKDGVKFMWNACFESCSNLNISTGGGCILAHCMGLGKYDNFYLNEKTRDKIS